MTERRLGVLLEQSIELVVHPAEPQGALGLSRVSVERSESRREKYSGTLPTLAKNISGG